MIPRRMRVSGNFLRRSLRGLSSTTASREKRKNAGNVVKRAKNARHKNRNINPSNGSLNQRRSLVRLSAQEKKVMSLRK